MNINYQSFIFILLLIVASCAGVWYFKLVPESQPTTINTYVGIYNITDFVLWSNLTDILTPYAFSNHTHDTYLTITNFTTAISNYYNQSEIDTLLDAYALTGHNHTGVYALLAHTHTFNVTTITIINYNGKIADITHADTSKHTINLTVVLSESRKIMWIELACTRNSGTGYMWSYPNNGSQYRNISSATSSGVTYICGTTINSFIYSLTVSGDDFDLFCFGYAVSTDIGVTS